MLHYKLPFFNEFCLKIPISNQTPYLLFLKNTEKNSLKENLCKSYFNSMFSCSKLNIINVHTQQ